MTDEPTITPAAEDPSTGLIVQTDNGLRPEDGDQLIDGRPVDDYTVEELLALGEAVPDE